MEQMTLLFEKLEQEKERAERLEGQVNDVTELHQHEVRVPGKWDGDLGRRLVGSGREGEEGSGREGEREVVGG